MSRLHRGRRMLAEALRERLTELRKHGFNRLFQNGRLFEFSTPESLLDLDFTQPVYILVDRIVITAGVPLGHSGSTNLLRVAFVGKPG